MQRIQKTRTARRQSGGHGCDHRVILPSRTQGQGRCLECGATVPTPSWLHAR